MFRKLHRVVFFAAAFLASSALISPAAFSQTVTYKPYIQPGDNGPFGAKDQIVVAWETNEASPKASEYSMEFGTSVSYGRAVTPQARVVDNYLSVDPTLASLVQATASGAHSNYSAVLADLEYNTDYFYRVSGPGMPTGGFAASFHSRKRGDDFSFIVEGDEGFFPTVPVPAGLRRGTPTTKRASRI
jgi:hypothetical protein